MSQLVEKENEQSTRERLIEAAGQIFAEKGFRATTIRDICEAAGANVAAVNYHFGDKEKLYAETWRYAFAQHERPAFSDLEGQPPEKQLRQLIRLLVKTHDRKKGLSHFMRLYLMELVNPTGLIQQDWIDLIGPRREKFLETVRQIIGPYASRESLLLCEMSVIHQCRALLIMKRGDLEYFLEHPLDEAMLDRLADHIVDFSIAGIKAVGQLKK